MGDVTDRRPRDRLVATTRMMNIIGTENFDIFGEPLRRKGPRNMPVDLAKENTETVLRGMQHCIRPTTSGYISKVCTVLSAELEKRFSAMTTRGQRMERTSPEGQHKDGTCRRGNC